MGWILGTVGGGGGILTVPILVGMFGMSAVQATGNSLLVVGIASSVGAIQGLVQKQTDVKAAALLAIPSTMGAFLSRAFIVPRIPEQIFGLQKDEVLLGVFASVMIYVGVKMLLPVSKETENTASWFKIAGFGLIIGLVSGILGAGGGFLILPVLTLYLGLSLPKAVSTSLLVICVQSLGGFAGELGKPIEWQKLGVIVIVALLGVVAGLTFRERAPQKFLQTGFSVLVFLVAGWMISKILMNHF